MFSEPTCEQFPGSESHTHKQYLFQIVVTVSTEVADELNFDDHQVLLNQSDLVLKTEANFASSISIPSHRPNFTLFLNAFVHVFPTGANPKPLSELLNSPFTANHSEILTFYKLPHKKELSPLVPKKNERVSLLN